MNNTQIDNTDYYILPCGRYLEDFIWHKRMSFAEGSALKYRWRKGRKDGEDADKDERKCIHYCKYISERGLFGRVDAVSRHIDDLVKEATSWNGRGG